MTTFSFVLQGLHEGVQNLISSILQGKKYRTYPEELRNFAINLHFYSPRAYLFINENFGDLLPCLSPLRTYLRQYDFKPGISPEALESARRLIEEGKQKGKHIMFNLTCDEMAIRPQPEWDASKKVMIGYVDYGSSKVPVDDMSKSTLASNALVFMLVAINSHFKIALAYYLIKSADGDNKEILLKDVLDACFENEIDVRNITFDGIGSNVTMARSLGAELRQSTTEVFFDYPVGTETKKIRVTLDSCHALKLVRNIFTKYNIVNERGETISFQCIKDLQKLQEKEELTHLANKLRKKHIYFNNDIMKVSIAAQTLSSSVAKALDFCREDLGLPEFKEAGATSEFCQNVNDSFDILNSRNIYNKNPGKHAISRSNLKSMKIKVNHLVHYFESLTINGTPILKTKQNTGFLGLITGLRNMIAIAEDLFATFHNFDFLLTYKFSQDHLETFFSCIRRLGGFNNNPTASI